LIEIVMILIEIVVVKF